MMTKPYINHVLVVEGKTDASYISSFYDVDIIVTNGYELDKSTIDFLNILSKIRPLLVLTDPDEAGEIIRSRIQLNNITHLKINENKCNKHNKHGVAECEKEALINYLNPYVCEKTNYHKITINNLLNLDLNNKLNREKFCKKHHLGNCNLKTLLKRLNMLQFDIEKVEKYDY